MMIYKPRGLNDWTRMVQQVYGMANSERGLTSADLLLHVVEETGEVARDFRKQEYHNLVHNLPDVFVWMCTFSLAYHVYDLERVVWHKFPGICPYCRGNKCVCDEKGVYDRDHEILIAARDNLEYQDYSLDDWEAMFRRIYGARNHEVSYEKIGFHLTEEIGEVYKELRRPGRRKQCLEEIADTFGWIFAIATKAPNMPSLSEAIWTRYPGKCYKCNQEVCDRSICDNL